MERSVEPDTRHNPIEQLDGYGSDMLEGVFRRIGWAVRFGDRYINELTDEYDLALDELRQNENAREELFALQDLSLEPPEEDAWGHDLIFYDMSIEFLSESLARWRDHIETHLREFAHVFLFHPLNYLTAEHRLLRHVQYCPRQDFRSYSVCQICEPNH